MLLLPPFFDAARFDLRRSTLSAVDFLLPAAPLVGDASAAESFAGLRTSCARAAGKHGSLITVTVMSSRYSPPCRRGVKRVGEVGLMRRTLVRGLAHFINAPRQSSTSVRRQRAAPGRLASHRVPGSAGAPSTWPQYRPLPVRSSGFVVVHGSIDRRFSRRVRPMPSHEGEFSSASWFNVPGST